MGNAPCFQGAARSIKDAEAPSVMNTTIDHVLNITLNGEAIQIPRPDPRMTLLEYIRDVAKLTGTKRSCLQGGCGACLVVVQRYDWSLRTWVAKGVNACLKPLASCDGMVITTVEGVGTERKGCHPIQERIAGNFGMQCGFCTPGMVMNAYALLKQEGKPTAQQCMDSYDGNICRCTGYRNLVNVSESFAKDASAECKSLANEYKTFDADNEKMEQREAPRRPISKVFASGDVTWYAPTTLSEVIALRTKLKRPPFVLGDTAKGMRQAAYETFGGKASSLIYLGNVDELNFIEESHHNLIFGAGMRIDDICTAVKKRADKLAYANELAAGISTLAQRHVRAEAGWAGNLMITRTGFPSDLVPCLLAVDAKVSFVTDNPHHEETINIEDFKQGHVPANALLTKLTLPLKTTGIFRYYRVAFRKWLAHAFVNAAFRIEVDPATKKVTEARVSVGVYGQGPKRSESAEEAFVGNYLDNETLQKVIKGIHTDFDDEFSSEAQYKSVDNPKGKDEYRKYLPDSYVFKFFQEAQAALGIKTWSDSELGLMKPLPLKRATLKYEDRPGHESRPQLSAPGLTTGAVKYTDDMPVPSLYGYPVVTTCATGKITRIDVGHAECADGVKAVITAHDVPGLNDAGFAPGEEPLFLAEGMEIQAPGQQICLVVATTYRQAKKAAALVKVDVSGSNVGAILTIDDAIAKDSRFPDTDCEIGEKDQVEAAMKKGTNRVTGSTWVIGQHGFPMEKQAACAIPEERGGMTVWSATQAPDFCRAKLAGILGLHGKGALVSVKCTRAGGGFGVKLSRNVPVAGAAAVAAHKVEEAVKVAYDAQMEHICVGGRHNFKVKYEVAYKDDGTIEACIVEAWGNAGYTHDFSGFLFLEFAEAVPSVYKWGNNFYLKVNGMKLNVPTNTAVRSFGNPQGMFVAETIIEHVASLVGKTAEEVREKNLLHGQAPITPWKQEMEFYNADMLYERVKSDARYKARCQEVEAYNQEHRWRKRGISVVPLCYGHSYVYAAGSGALVNIHSSDGSVTVHHGGCEIGQGIHVKVAQVVAMTLGCDVEAVKVAETNTDTIPNMRFTGGSITSEICCEAARRACLELNATMEPHRQFLRKKKKAALEEKKSKGDYILPDEHDTEPTWMEVVSASNALLGHQEKLSATGIFSPTSNRYTTDVEGNPNGKPFHGDYFTYGAACSEVEVDILTGEIQTLRSDILFDVGKSINAGIDIGQIEGAFAWGIGYYLFEEPLMDSKGVDRTQGVWEYKPPMASEMPRELSVELVRDNPGPAPVGVLGSKAVAEPPFMLAYSIVGAVKKAIAAARKDAGASTVFDLPMPVTIDAIQRACAVTPSQMKC
mmetsp:Transcript_70086/g.146571  ORF Transcript_70086/g.146571 Transcript_70086/m.146571 type:complete len:1344 (-) Transcript_70086:302-4333(-)